MSKKNKKTPERDSKGRFVKKSMNYSGYWSPIGSVGPRGAGFGAYDVYGTQPEPTPFDLVQAYEDITYSCVSLISNSLAGIRLRLVATTEQGEARPQSRVKHLPTFEKQRLGKDFSQFTRRAVNLEEVTDHPLIDLLERPNPYQNLHKLLGMTQTYLDLCGSAFWFLARNPLGIIKEIWLLPSQCISIITDDNGKLRSYKNVPLHGGEPQEYAPEDVIHFRFFNPSDPYTSFGVSPARSVWQRIQLLRQELSSWQSVLTNMAFPSALVFPPEGEVWTDLQAERTAKQIEERFRMGNQGGVWVIQDQIQYQAVSTPPKDLAALTMYDQIKKIICNAYHVPITLLDMSDNAYNTAQTSRRSFQMDCLKPRAINLLETITHRLCPGRLFFATDEIVEPDQTFELQRTSALWQANLLTQNEARSSQGLDSVAGGDRYLYQLLGSGGNSGMGTLPSFQKSKGLRLDASREADPSPLVKVLQQTFQKFASEYQGGAKQIVELRTKGFIPFKDWHAELTEAVTPVLKTYLEEGSSNVVNAFGVETVFGLPVQSLDSASKKAAERLSDSTLRTTELDVEAAHAATRAAIQQGLAENEANLQLAQRIQNIFKDLTERRCFLIADTESNRVKHQGELMTIQENGLDAKKVWLCDSMACPVCTPLNGQVKELNEPFHVDSKGGPYAVTESPPRHPQCRCTLTYEVE